MDSEPNRGVRGLHRGREEPKARFHPRLVEPAASAPPQPRGINVAGLEFGTEKLGYCNAFPGQLGKDYFLNSLKTFEELVSAGFASFRIPFSWERIQPKLEGPLDPDGVQHLRLLISLVQRTGASVVLDLHNYGRYTTLLDEAAVACPLEEAVDGLVRLSSDHLADFWSRISHALSGQPGIIGYGLMNEPHDLAAGAWVRASRAAVEAIRREGDRTPIYVAGDRWSDAGRWTQVNPTSPWIEDPENKITYEAHCYLDHDGSGQYELTYEEELDYDPYIKGRAAKRLGPFLGWLKEWGVEGALGEFAVPCQNEPWTALLPEMMKLLDEAHVPSYWWAAGEYWGDYPLSLQPPCEQEPPRSAQLELFRS